MTAASIGLDIGSTSFKAVAIDAAGNILASIVEPTSTPTAATPLTRTPRRTR